MTDIAAGSPSSIDTDPLAGTGYRAVRRIGAGAMGEVFEAEQTGLRRKVAVKLLTPALAGDAALVDRLRLEAQALASVRHPNVVLVHDHARTPGGIPFLVMELLQGRTLDELLRDRGTLAVPEALQILGEVFSGLSAIHAAGLTHRDLKPANVFLSEERGRTTVKLLDFGIVKVAARDGANTIAPLRFPTQEGHVVGTPRFMAPEQVRGLPCDARTDVYAAGVLVFLLLSGRDPFHHHRSNMAILTAQAMEPPPRLSTVASQAIPPGIDAAVARALAKQPAQRFASIADFGAALVAAAEAQSPPPGPTGTEKMTGARWRAAPPHGTAPIDASVFRAARRALPFVATGGGEAPQARSDLDAIGAAAGTPTIGVVRPPCFGLPPVSPGATGEIAVLPAGSAAQGSQAISAWAGWGRAIPGWRLGVGLAVLLLSLAALFAAWKLL